MKVFVFKGKYMYMFICIAVAILGVVLGLFSKNEYTKNSINVNNAKTTKKIVLDAGHGLPDVGTTGVNGTQEQKLNLEISLKLEEILKNNGFCVVLTRKDENGIYDKSKKNIKSKKIDDTEKRVSIGNSSEADIYISIHMNYYKDAKYDGWQTFYQNNNKKSQKLAECIQDALNDTIEKKNRIPMSIKDVYIMDNVKIPTVIVECGFLSNAQEEKKLNDEEYQKKIALGIFNGVKNYFEVE